MGMFDWVDVSAFEFPFTALRGYQTKDFDCLMDTIIFKADGTIERARDVLESTPEEEMPYYGKPEWDKPFGKVIGALRVKETVIDKLGLPEDDVIHFYGTTDEESLEWIDIYADVKNHKVVRFRWTKGKYPNELGFTSGSLDINS